MMRALAPALAFAAVIVACSGTDSVSSISTGPTNGSSGTVSSSGVVGTSGSAGSSSSSSSSGATLGPLIDVTGATAIIASTDTCGKPAGSCGDAQKFTIDFQNTNVVHTTCVEPAGDAGTSGGTQNVDQKRALTADEVKRVQASLAAIHTATLPAGEDGQMFALQVIKATSSQLYSPGVYCGDKTQFIGVDSAGFSALWSTLTALGN
jgi:hypothetical protein